MPNKRLPWLKFWPELVDHPKFANLTDGERWTWTKLLARAGQQPKRGEFVSIRHAVDVTGRPVAHLRRLVEVGLLDETPTALLMHDWQQWQRWRPEDDGGNDDPSAVDQHANGTRTTHDQHGIDTRKKKDVEERRRDNPPGGAPVPNRNGQVIDALRSLGLQVTLTARDHAAIKNSDAPPGLIAEVYSAVCRGEYGDDFMRKRLSIHEAIEWVNGYAAWKQNGKPVERVNGRPPEQQINRKDRTFEDPLTRDD